MIENEPAKNGRNGSLLCNAQFIPRFNRTSRCFQPVKNCVLMLICVQVFAVLLFGCSGSQPAPPEKTITPSYSQFQNICPQQYQKLQGMWDVKKQLLVQHYGNHRYEHLRFYFDKEGAFLESFYPVRGFVRLSLVHSTRHSYGCSSLAFKFDPLQVTANQRGQYNLMSTGLVRIMVPDVWHVPVQAIFYSDPNQTHGSRVTLEKPKEAYARGTRGPSMQMYYYKDWSTNKNTGSIASHRKELRSTFKELYKQKGFRCISQQTFTVHDGMPLTRVETANLPGPIAFVFFSPNAGKEFSYFFSHGDPRNRVHLTGPIGYPTIVFGDQWSRPRRYTIHFQYRPHDMDSTEVNPPVDITIFLLTQVPGSISGTPCEPQFRSPLIAPELKVFLALISDRVHQSAYAKKYELVGLLAGLGRNKLMSEGLAELFPELSSFEVDLLGREIIAISNLDVIDFTTARFRAELYETIKSSLKNESVQYAPKVFDVILDMFLRRQRDAFRS